MSENAYTGIIPGLGVKLATKLATKLAIFTLCLKMIISLYNKDLITDSYYFG